MVEVSFVLCCCFLARAPGSLAGGFLVAVAGRARFVLLVLVETSVGMVLFCVSLFSPAQWAPPQLNGPVQRLVFG